MRKILKPGRNCQGIYNVNSTGLLIDGRNYYRAFYDAARQAKKYILIAGWQFERSVKLLRGRDLREADAEVRLGPFLDELCRKNPDLQVFILMWDFSPIVAFDKEWFNKLVLDFTSSERIFFRFDSNHPVWASHHQKLIVVDGALAFVGGLDICAGSWDDRNHAAGNLERSLADERYEPYHDVQSFQTGPAAWALTELFKKRWVHAGGSELYLPPPENSNCPKITRYLSVAASSVAISVTRPRTVVPMLKPVQEIRALYRDAIGAAEKLIYMENQYFTSEAVYQALKKRIADRSRPKPQIVVVLPKRLHTFVEDISLSIIQAKMLRSLTEIASRSGSVFRVYYSAASPRSGEPEKSTYIHSKVLIVDDRFMSVGSANITNRSMGMDTELNVSWEAESPEEDQLARSIRKARANLLAEHAGIRKPSDRRRLGSIEGLVEFLDSVADRTESRLRRHTLKSFLEDIAWIKDLVPDDLSIDPEKALIEENIYEAISRDRNGIFARGLLFLNDLGLAQSSDQRESRKLLEVPAPEAVSELGSIISSLGHRGVLGWYLLAGMGLGIGAIMWLLFR